MGEDVGAYGRVLTPNILRVFPDDIFRRWIIYAKSQKISEGDITQLIQFLSEEEEGAVTTNKIKQNGSLAPDYPLKSSLENFNVHSLLLRSRHVSFMGYILVRNNGLKQM